MYKIHFFQFNFPFHFDSHYQICCFNYLQNLHSPHYLHHHPHYTHSLHNSHYLNYYPLNLYCSYLLHHSTNNFILQLITSLNSLKIYYKLFIHNLNHLTTYLLHLLILDFANFCYSLILPHYFLLYIILLKMVFFFYFL